MSRAPDLAEMVRVILTAGTPRIEPPPHVVEQAEKQAPRRFAPEPIPLTGFGDLPRYVRETNELDGTDDGSDWREQRAQDLRDSERGE
jgi:hypothetical protein